MDASVDSSMLYKKQGGFPMKKAVYLFGVIVCMVVFIGTAVWGVQNLPDYSYVEGKVVYIRDRDVGVLPQGNKEFLMEYKWNGETRFEKYSEATDDLSLTRTFLVDGDGHAASFNDYLNVGLILVSSLGIAATIVIMYVDEKKNGGEVAA